MFAMIFATIGVCEFCVYCALILCVVSGIKAAYAQYLLHNNPEAWRALQAAEEDKKERKRKALGGVLWGGISIARIFWGK